MITDAARPASLSVSSATTIIRSPFLVGTSEAGQDGSARDSVCLGSGPAPGVMPAALVQPAGAEGPAASDSTLSRVLFTGLFLGLSALSALPSPVHASTVATVAVTELPAASSAPASTAVADQKAPATQASHVFEDVFTGAYPRPADWREETVSFGNVEYHTVVPPGWSIAPSGTGFVIRKDADPRVFLEVKDAAATGDLRQVIAAQREQLARQGISLREQELISMDPLLISVNEVKGSAGSRQAEIIAIVDIESANGPVSASVTSVVYKKGEDREVFPTILQNTHKTITMDAPLPIVR